MLRYGFAAVLVSAAAVGPALAAPINYGNFVGTTVTYLNVTEDEVPSSINQVARFGAPTISGDSLDFDPVSFSASASGAGGNASTAANVQFDIQAAAGKAISNVLLTEAGNTSLSGFSNDAFTSVTGDVVIDIEEVDGAPVPGGSINIPATMVFTPSNGDYQLSVDGTGPLFNSQWSGTVWVDLNQVLTTAGIPFTGGATLVSVSLTNTLTALSQSGTQALITKQDADGVVVTVNIPEPTAVLLGGLGILASLAARRR